jgi:hypothetical protein
MGSIAFQSFYGLRLKKMDTAIIMKIAKKKLILLPLCFSTATLPLFQYEATKRSHILIIGAIVIGVS